MIKKSLIVLALSTSIISSTIYASERGGLRKISVTLGDSNNPVMGLYLKDREMDPSGGNDVIFTIAKLGEIFNSQKTVDNKSFLKFLSTLNQGRDDLVGLYDNDGTRGLIVGGKTYTSIFALVNDMKIAVENPYSPEDAAMIADINRAIRSLGRKIEDKETKNILIQEELQFLIKGAATNGQNLSALNAQIVDLSKTITQASKASELPSVITPDNLATEIALYTASDAVTDLIEGRMDTSDAGAAAGDLMQSFGVWVKGMIGTAKQKEMKFVSEYKINQQGITIGADIGEYDLVGVAFTMLVSTVKNSNMKEKTTNYIGSIYGLYNFTDNVFLNGQLKYGRSNIKKDRNTLDSNKNIAHAKAKGAIMGGKVELGYYYDLMDKSRLIPSIGLSYDAVKIKKYKETGDNLLTRSVGKRNCDKTSLIGGLVVNHVIGLESFRLTPEIHTNVSYVLKRNTDNTIITLLEGTNPISVPSGKLPKISYRIGGSLTASKSKNLELSIGYDFGLAKKFRSHSGYIQARVDF